MGNAYSNMTDFWGQSFRIPPPPLTEKNLPDQTGKVFMITGGYAGVGAQLATILYQHNATVWIAGRSSSKAEACIQDIQSKHPDSKGHLHFLSVDLSDLTTIKPAVSKFLAEAKQLHWLNHNAGVMVPPPQSKGAQGMDLTYQTNILGPFLLTKLLLPILKSTAASSTPNTVRVSFAGSLAVVLQSPPGGVEWTTDGKDLAHGLNDPATSYGTSKAANFLFGREFPKHSGTEGVLFNVSFPSPSPLPPFLPNLFLSLRTFFPTSHHTHIQTCTN